MEINSIRSDEIYQKIIQAPIEKKEDIYRYELMKPFEEKWACYNVPLHYLFTLLLADPKSPYTVLNEGHCGDGGIPGYIFGSLLPNDYTMKRMPAVLAHECNHNVRFQFEKWRQDITLAEMLVHEGLAENYATILYGEEAVGPWVSKTNIEELQDYIKPILQGGLDATGFDQITAYLYGDEMANMRGFFPVGLPYCAGYACGYHMIKYYLKRTGKSIIEATITPSADILKEVEDFWC